MSRKVPKKVGVELKSARAVGLSCEEAVAPSSQAVMKPIAAETIDRKMDPMNRIEEKDVTFEKKNHGNPLI